MKMDTVLMVHAVNSFTMSFYQISNLIKDLNRRERKVSYSEEIEMLEKFESPIKPKAPIVTTEQ